jgi:glutamyl-tRNA reductase
VKAKDIDKKGKKIYMYDLAVPRDFEEEIYNLKRTEVYNIDEISRMDDENKKLRIKKMKEYKYILMEYLNEYEEWLKKENVPNIKN